MFKDKKVFIKCSKGITPYLRKEVEQLGYKVLDEYSTGIEIKASLEDAARLNLYLRTALHVIYFIKKFKCEGPDQLYNEVYSLPWEELIDPEEYISVVSITDTEFLNNSMFANQRVKDAIVDRMVNKCGKRPVSGSSRDNIVINLSWKDDNAWLYLDTSGNKLSDRTYRKFPHTAPLQETLAASLLLAAGFDGSVPLVNPMCGSGTLAIEAALIALHRAPGLLRNNFGFMHLKNFNSVEWLNIRKQAEALSLDKIPSRIIASDSDVKAVNVAKKNAQSAGVDKFIEFHVCDFSATPLPEEKGIVMLNPEYGMRLGDEQKLEEVYKNIGEFFKKSCAGFKGYIFTGNMNLAKKVGLRPSRKIPFFNAQIECRLLEYDIYT